MRCLLYANGDPVEARSQSGRVWIMLEEVHARKYHGWWFIGISAETVILYAERHRN